MKAFSIQKRGTSDATYSMCLCVHVCVSGVPQSLSGDAFKGHVRFEHLSFTYPNRPDMPGTTPKLVLSNLVEALRVQWCRLKGTLTRWPTSITSVYQGPLPSYNSFPILDVAVIRGVTMDLKPGTVTAIVGPSGCVL
jgi:ABC-type multidrug transport system fused ATPase/permease subunit